MTCIHHVAEAVQAVRKHRQQEATKRIDFPTRSGVTFFSGKDIWLFDPREDNITCDLCRSYADLASAMGGINGNMIRALFPYLAILDENTIGGMGENGRGLVHKWCRCRLRRFIGDPADSVPAQKALVPSKLKPDKLDPDVVDDVKAVT